MTLSPVLAPPAAAQAQAEAQAEAKREAQAKYELISSTFIITIVIVAFLASFAVFGLVNPWALLVPVGMAGFVVACCVGGDKCLEAVGAVALVYAIFCWAFVYVDCGEHGGFGVGSCDCDDGYAGDRCTVCVSGACMALSIELVR